MRFLPGNAQHIGAREEQQDSFAFSDPSDENFLSHGGLLALVSDGMGGLSNGHQASLAAVRAFLAAYERKQPAESIPAAMHRSLQETFDVVHELNRSSAGQSGATLVAAAAHDRELYWVSIGDSRLYLIRQGRLVQLSRDHNYREKLLEQVAGDRLGLAEALSHPEREHLTSFLGMVGVPEVDGNVRPFRLEPDDLVILCSDGVYRALPEADFVRAFAAGNPSAGCEAAKAAVLGRASQEQDNLTIAAFRCVSGTGNAIPAFGNVRSKLPLAGAFLLLGANVYAASIAVHQVRTHMAVLKHAGSDVAKPKGIDSTPAPERGASKKATSPRNSGPQSKPAKERSLAKPSPEPSSEQPAGDPAVKPNEPDSPAAGGLDTAPAGESKSGEESPAPEEKKAPKETHKRSHPEGRNRSKD